MSRLVVVALLCHLTAQAQSVVTLNKAKAHFKQGAAFYSAGVYDRAIVEYEAAYRLVPLADLLFNLGQAHYKLGDRVKAADYYQKYLAADPNGTARAEARERLREITALADKERAAADAAARRKAAEAAAEKAAVEKSAAATAAADAEARKSADLERARRDQADRVVRKRRMRIAGLAVGAVGIASLIVGATFVGLAKNADDQLLHPKSGIYSPSADDRRANYQVVDAAFFGVGGAAVATGLGVFLAGKF